MTINQQIIPFGTHIVGQDPVHRIIFQKVGQVGGIGQVIDRHYLIAFSGRTYAIFKKCPEREASNTPESVDPDSDAHPLFLSKNMLVDKDIP
jgi:hypothetical protein